MLSLLLIAVLAADPAPHATEHYRITAEGFDAAEAERIGLVNRAVPDEEFMSFVYDYARDMAQNCSPTSLAIMKRQIYQDLTASLEQANDKSFELMIESFGRPEMDASLLTMHDLGFIEADDPRFVSTVECIGRHLLRGKHMFRYIAADDFGEGVSASIQVATLTRSAAWAGSHGSNLGSK